MHRIQCLPIERDSVFHHFILLSENRDLTRNLLENAGIKTEIHYPETAEKSFNKFETSFDVHPGRKASTLASKTLSIPISPWMNDLAVQQTIDAVLNSVVLSSIITDRS